MLCKKVIKFKYMIINQLEQRGTLDRFFKTSLDMFSEIDSAHQQYVLFLKEPTQFQAVVRLIQPGQRGIQHRVKVPGRAVGLGAADGILHRQRAAQLAADAVAVHGILGHALHQVALQKRVAVVLQNLRRIAADVGDAGAGLGQHRSELRV